MKNINQKCEECNSSISYESDMEVYRCIECGVITDSEGCVLYDAATMLDL